MTSITTRAGKGSPLTHNEVDANFTNLNTDKLDTAGTGNLTITNTAPAIRLVENGGTTTHNESMLVRDGDSFQHQTRDSAGTYVSSDYLISAGASGATDHAWRIANTERLRIDGSGNVGIGTSAPVVPLEVSGPSAQIRVIDSAVDMRLLPLAGSSVGVVGTISNHALSLFTNNAERLRITSAGSMGIGTSSPTTLLDVNADTVRVRTARTPVSATATGATGEICWDANYIYVCTATNTWRRTAISSW